MKNQDRPAKEFSGGWRMRISIARGLYIKPQLLILDEPTNHLDLEATIWLIDYLKKWKNTLMIVSHDSRFLDEITDNIIEISNNKLHYYRGNYEAYLRTKQQNRKHQEKEWKKVEKTVNDMRRKGLTKNSVDKYISSHIHLKPTTEKPIRIRKIRINKIESALVEIKGLSIGYDTNILLSDFNASIDMNTRIALVGRNGSGKSSLMKAILNYTKLIKDGEVIRNKYLRIGYYNQQSSDLLPKHLAPVEYLLSINDQLKNQDAHQLLGLMGLDTRLHKAKIETLSGGQKSIVALTSTLSGYPNLLLLDEPTNHLDIERITSLIDFIEDYGGGVLMITHNIDFIYKTGAILWEIDNGKVNITDYDTYHNKVIDIFRDD